MRKNFFVPLSAPQVIVEPGMESAVTREGIALPVFWVPAFPAGIQNTGRSRPGMTLFVNT